MNRIVLLMMICCLSLSVTAQKNTPKWMDKARKAVFTVTTYDKDNRQSGTGYGVFISESGDAVSGYSLFNGAGRAVVTDFEGKEYPVTYIVGVDEMYDVIKFKVGVPKKVTYLPLSPGVATENDDIYHVQYSTGKDMKFTQGKIKEVSKLKADYGYYEIDIPVSNDLINTPVVNVSGDLIGLTQEDASGKGESGFAISAAYVNSLKQSSVDIFNQAYRNVGIKKAWPSNIEDASVSLFLMSSQQDAHTYLETLNDFISTFPNAPEGYENRASHYAYRRMQLGNTPEDQKRYLDMARADYQTAARYATDKGDVYFNEAKLIYSLVLEDQEMSNPQWTMDVAIEVLQKAINEKDVPVYRQLEGDINMYQGNFEQAYESYRIVCESDLATPVSFYWAAKAKENIPGVNIGDLIDLLTKAIEKTGVTPSQEAAPFVLERVEKWMMLSQFDKAIEDYDTYHYLVNGQVNDTFFYLREQAKYRAGDLEGALVDIQEAIKIDPENPDYFAEEASVYTRMQNYEKALESVNKALAIAPDFGACYRLQGVCYQRMEKKSEACESFEKAKEHGDPLADKLIKENCK